MADASQPAVALSTGFLPAEPPRKDEQDVSIFGMMLLSTVTVGVAVLGMLAMGLAVMGIYWLAIHIPVPAFVLRILTHLGII